jgi:hypothetical protein
MMQFYTGEQTMLVEAPYNEGWIVFWSGKEENYDLSTNSATQNTNFPL